MSKVSYLFEDPVGWYNWALAKQDPVSMGYPLMNPLVSLAIIFAYLITIWLLIQVMSRREKPLNVYYLALIHNIVLTFLSLYMCVEIIRQALLNKYSFWGNGIDYKSPYVYGMANVLWIFYFSKTLEFLDTIIMCLKKKLSSSIFLTFISSWIYILCVVDCILLWTRW